MISLHGGQVLSFKPHHANEDFLFVSDKAIYNPNKAIRGGIPICWPWFGAGITAELPAHGFVRTQQWNIEHINLGDNNDINVKLSCADTASTRQLWQSHFYLSLSITISDSLSLALTTKNTGTTPFSITEALHSYFNTADVEHVKVLGLGNTYYLDKTEAFAKKQQQGAIHFSQEIDRIYLQSYNDLTIDDPILKRQLKIHSSGHQNMVVWNPWAKGAGKMADLKSNDYQHFICVETANTASNPIEILPNHQHTTLTNYSLIK